MGNGVDVKEMRWLVEWSKRKKASPRWHNICTLIRIYSLKCWHFCDKSSMNGFVLHPSTKPGTAIFHIVITKGSIQTCVNSVFEREWMVFWEKGYLEGEQWYGFWIYFRLSVKIYQSIITITINIVTQAIKRFYRIVMGFSRKVETTTFGAVTKRKGRTCWTIATRNYLSSGQR